MKKIYYIECGVLLDKDNGDYDWYSNAFDKKHAFYDEYVDFTEDLEIAKKYCNDYIKNGVNGTYGIISQVYVDCDINIDDCYDYLIGDSDLYDVKNVIYNAWKLKNNDFKFPNKNAPIIENFLEI